MRRGNSQRADFPQMKYLEELQREELHLEGQMLLPEVETLEFVKEGRSIVINGSLGNVLNGNTKRDSHGRC